MDPGSLMEAGWRKSSEAGVIPHPRNMELLLIRVDWVLPGFSDLPKE